MKNSPHSGSRSWLVVAGDGVEGGGADRKAVTGGRLDQSAPSLGAQPIAVASDRQHVAVMQEPVEDGGGDDGVGEHRAPLGDAAVRGYQHRAGLVAAADELEEQMRGVGLERQIAKLIDDQQLRLGEADQLLVKPLLAMRLGEACDQRHCCRELYRVARQNCFAAERDREMRLAHTGRAEQKHVFAVGDPAGGGQVADLLGIEGGLRLEVEARQLLHRRKVSQLQCHLDAAVILTRDLTLAQQGERLPRRQVDRAASSSRLSS